MKQVDIQEFGWKSVNSLLVLLEDEQSSSDSKHCKNQTCDPIRCCESEIDFT